MSRPRKCRKVCRLPAVREFLPAADVLCFIQLTVDEYESIRLIDKEGFSQKECAGYMQVARTTVRTIYNSARSKLADALVGGKGIRKLARQLGNVKNAKGDIRATICLRP